MHSHTYTHIHTHTHTLTHTPSYINANRLGGLKVGVQIYDVFDVYFSTRGRIDYAHTIRHDTQASSWQNCLGTDTKPPHKQRRRNENLNDHTLVHRHHNKSQPNVPPLERICAWCDYPRIKPLDSRFFLSTSIRRGHKSHVDKQFPTPLHLGPEHSPYLPPL